MAIYQAHVYPILNGNESMLKMEIESLWMIASVIGIIDWYVWIFSKFIIQRMIDQLDLYQTLFKQIN